jgi:hypothetical protein
MKHFALFVSIAVLLLGIVLGIAHWALVTPLNREAGQTGERQKDLEEQLQEIEVQFQALSGTLPASSPVVVARARTLLRPGREGRLLADFLEATKRFRVDIEGLTLHPPMTITSPRSEQARGGAPSPGGQQPAGEQETLPQLDDQGMPVGYQQDSEEETSLECVQMTFQHRSTFRGFGQLLQEMERTMPWHGIRQCGLTLHENGILSGLTTVLFPVREGRAAARPEAKASPTVANDPGDLSTPPEGE